MCVCVTENKKHELKIQDLFMPIIGGYGYNRSIGIELNIESAQKLT